MAFLPHRSREACPTQRHFAYHPNQRGESTGGCVSAVLRMNADTIAVTYYLVTTASILAGLVGILRNFRQESARRLRETHQSVSSAYVRLLEQSLAHPEVPLLDEHLMLRYFAIESDHPDIQAFRKRWIFYSLTVNCFENAFIALHSAPNKVHRRQWDGWEEWISDTFSEPEFGRMWDDFKDSFDQPFAARVDEILANRV
jgi:hypothetical protein